MILLIILIKDFKKPLIEGVDDGQGGTHTSDSVQDMDEDEIKDELRRIREENYSDLTGFEAILQKGQCTNEEDGPNCRANIK